MKVLLDECVPRKFKRHFSGYECQTVPEAGLSGMKNGALLSRAEQLAFDVLITVDQGFAYQQSVAGRNISVVVIFVRSNQIEDVEPHASACLQALSAIGPGTICRMGNAR